MGSPITLESAVRDLRATRDLCQLFTSLGVIDPAWLKYDSLWIGLIIKT